MKTTLTLLASTLISATCLAEDVQFFWNASTTPNVTYKVQWGTAANRTNLLVAGTNLTVTLSNAPVGILRAVALATLVTVDGPITSLPSNEVTWTNRPAPPGSFRIPLSLQTAATPLGPWQEVATVTQIRPNTGSNEFLRVVLSPPIPEP